MEHSIPNIYTGEKYTTDCNIDQLLTGRCIKIETNERKITIYILYIVLIFMKYINIGDMINMVMMNGIYQYTITPPYQ
jgi:hypothetical protein